MHARTLSLFAGAAGLLCGTAVASVPQCTNVTLAPIPGGAEISYDLDSDAAVTLELFDDGVALSPDALQTLKGDGWGFVKSGTGRKIVWKGYRDVPNQRYANLKAVVTAWDPDIPPPYMVVDLRPGKGTVAYYASADKVPLGVTNRMYKTTHLVLAKVPAAGRTWTLGSMPGAESTPRREIQRSVALTEDYYLGIYPVTGGQWLQFKATNPSSSHFYGADKDVSPVEAKLVDIPEFKAEFAKMADAIREKGATPVFCSPITAGRYDKKGKYADTPSRLAYGNATKEIAAEKKVDFVDMARLTAAELEKLL